MRKLSQRSFEAIKGNREWSWLERELIEGCREGLREVGINRLPSIGDPDTRVRAELITYLLIGGCKGGVRPLASGLRLKGAWIDGLLDFRGQKSTLKLKLMFCRIPNGIDFKDACLGATVIEESEITGLVNCKRLITKNNFYIRRNSVVNGAVTLVDAKIGGSLGFAGSTLIVDKSLTHSDVIKNNETVLNCDKIRVENTVFLNGGFRACGNIVFVRANLRGTLRLEDAALDGNLNMHACTIQVGFFFRKLTGKIPKLLLMEARVGTLNDDLSAWKLAQMYRISGFVYDRLETEIRLKDRLEIWNNKFEKDLYPAMWKPRRTVDESIVVPQKKVLTYRKVESDFDTQPHNQLARVLEAQGNFKGAARVRFKRDHLTHRAARNRTHSFLEPTLGAIWQSIWADFRKIIDTVFLRILIGYGHHPGRILPWIITIIVFAWFLYGNAYHYGQMAPNSDVILTSVDWVLGVDCHDACKNIGKSPCIQPLHAWEKTPSFKDFETFSGFLYAIDLFIPLDALGQEKAWAPTRGRGMWGEVAYWARMPIQLLGWIITAVCAAVLAGSIGRKDR